MYQNQLYGSTVSMYPNQLYGSTKINSTVKLILVHAPQLLVKATLFKNSPATAHKGVHYGPRHAVSTTPVSLLADGGLRCYHWWPPLFVDGTRDHRSGSVYW